MNRKAYEDARDALLIDVVVMRILAALAKAEGSA